MAQSPQFTFQDFLSKGSSMAAAPIEPHQFKSLIGELNDRFHLDLDPRPEALEMLRDRLRYVAGRHWQESGQVDRKSIDARLQNLSADVQGVIASLQPVRLGIQDDRDIEFINFLARILAFRHRDMTISEGRDQLETILRMVESLGEHCDCAAVILSQIPAKSGRRALGWYDDFVELMVAVAGILGLSVTTRGSASKEPEETPFTVFVFQVERFLPREAWSNSLAACAKRIQASLKRRPGAAGKNATPT